MNSHTITARLKEEPLLNKLLALGYAALILSLCFSMYQRVSDREVAITRSDIRAQFEDAYALTLGENPYSRISDPSKPQDRITFYFPGFLLASAIAITTGYSDYAAWLGLWQKGSMLCHIAIAFVLFLFIYRHSSLSTAIIGSAFWCTARWPLSLYRSGQIDGPAILFLLLAVYVWSSSKTKAHVCFGLSLAIKQMAIFLFPLFLMWAWHAAPVGNRFRQVMRAAFECLFIPALLCLPFFLWNPADFIQTSLFPLTRPATEPYSLQAFLGLEGVKRKIPFFLMLLIILVECAKNRLSRIQQSTLLLLLLISYTNTFFSRHFNWLLPFIILLATECFVQQRGRDAN